MKKDVGERLHACDGSIISSPRKRNKHQKEETKAKMELNWDIWRFKVF
jgi:hypothetical protein